MTSWTAFVGQVARLRRLVVRVVARARVRGRPVDPMPAAADVHASGPPAHWVERVRQGAPGLLEPSLRSRGEPVRPATEDIAPPTPDATAELELEAEAQIEAERSTEAERELGPQPVPRAHPDGKDVATREQIATREESTAEPPGPTSLLSRAPLLRKARSLRKAPSVRKAPVLRSVLHRKPLPAAVRPVPADPSATPSANVVPTEPGARAAPQPTQQQPDPPATALRVARPPLEEAQPTRDTASPAAHDEPEHRQHRSSAVEHRSSVVEFEAPVAEAHSARVERAAGHMRAVTADSAQPTADRSRSERLLEVTRPVRAPERLVAPPPPRSRQDVERTREPAPQRPRTSVESSIRAAQAAAFHGHDDPLSTVDVDPWPMLPTPPDHADDDVEVALRAWERQRRLDREQTRL